MIPFSPPYIRQEAIDEVVDTLKSGWITTGPKTKRFENEITKYCGSQATLCVNSATFGLELILRWFGVKPGDEVIIPAYTYTATANVIMHTGATPVMVDINSNDFNIDVEQVKSAVTARTKVIIPVDIAGYPSDIDDLMRLAKENAGLFNSETKIQKKMGRILILSDSAHSFGAFYDFNRVGKNADISIFSFHAVKNLTTAEGGAITIDLPDTFDSKSIYNYLNTFSLHGQNKDSLAKNEVGGWKYDVLEPGYKGNMTDIQASLGLVALKYYDLDNLPRRKQIFYKYTKEFEQCEWAELPVYESSKKTSSFHIYLLRIKKIGERERDEIINRIFNKKVAVNVHFKPLPLLSAYKKRGYDINNYPVAFNNYSRVITLPVNEMISDKELDQVINAVIESVGESL